MIVFEFLFDEKFFCKSAYRYRKQLFKGKLSRIRLILCVLFGILLTLMIYAGAYGAALVVFIGILILVFNDQFFSTLMKIQFRTHLYRNESFRIVLDEESVSSTSGKQFVNLSWDNFIKARKFQDGFMVFQKEVNHYVWLPISKLVKGTEEEVDILIKSKIDDYKTF